MHRLCKCFWKRILKKIEKNDETWFENFLNFKIQKKKFDNRKIDSERTFYCVFELLKSKKKKK